MKAIVIGGTGATGKELINELINDDEITQIISLVRKPKGYTNSKIEEKLIDFNHLDNYASYIHGDLAFSCLGTTLKDAGSKEAQWKIDYDYQYEFAKIAQANHIKTFVLLSAQNAKSNSFFFYAQMKGKLEEAVKDLGFQHLVIARPSLLIRPNTKRMGEKIGASVIQFFNRLGFFNNQQALPVQMVAKALLKKGKYAQEKLNIIEVKEIIELNQ